MKSSLYVGWVRHRRREPVGHAFRYPVFLTCLDLAELPEVFAGRWLWSVERRNVVSFRRADYLGPREVPLDTAVRDLVERRTGRRPKGPIRLLTSLRVLGHCFNPVSFYYCRDEADERTVAVVAEITNTPWGERHAYVLPAGGEAPEGQVRVRFPKAFHVSPFMGMEVEHDWRFTEPGERLVVHVVNRARGRETFDATLSLDRRPVTGGNLARALLRFPLGSALVVAQIYWQALRLWLKRVPFFPHPVRHPESAARAAAAAALSSEKWR